MRNNNRFYLKDYRKELRGNMTKQEILLWKYLKNSQLEGRKFRRQHSFNKYIIDFYCASEKLAVELDGEHHYTIIGFERDKIRDELFSKFGIRTLRIENEHVFNNLESVLNLIKSQFQQK